MEVGELRRGFIEQGAFTLRLDRVIERRPLENIHKQYLFNTMELANENFRYKPSTDPHSLPVECVRLFQF